MSDFLQQASRSARQAVQAKNWPQVKALSLDIIGRHRNRAEGYFLLGLAEKAAHRYEQAVKAFKRAIASESDRYDAAVELAGVYMKSNECGAAVKLIGQYEDQLASSPRYLNIAAGIYTDAGLPHQGWPLFKLANELQPGVQSLQAKLAACSVYVGKIDEACRIYRDLLDDAPNHQRYHYELSRLRVATDSKHIEEMQTLLDSTQFAAAKNVFVYYALGKECEDLEQWDKAFDFYKKAGDAARSVADYDVADDVALIDKVIEVCDEDWLHQPAEEIVSDPGDKTPIFIVGLPRTGTTLLERILSSHSSVESVGESYFLQSAIEHVGRHANRPKITPATIESAATKNRRRISRSYLQAIEYRFGDKPYFIEKFPENFLHLGFIAKAFPDAHIIHVKRNPLDSCFAMYKQSYFRYAYSFDDLGPYYVAYRRLAAHWQKVLGRRMIEVEYESVVADQRTQTELVLTSIGLPFEESCLNFEKNETASNTASTVQIREKIHSRSVGRWRRFRTQLEPLRRFLENAGIEIS